MFALFHSEAAVGEAPAVRWLQNRNISNASNGQISHPGSSVLDLLAAPTVFMQQALVYQCDLDSSALLGAIQDVLKLQPLFAARLSAGQVRCQGLDQIAVTCLLNLLTESASISKVLAVTTDAGRAALLSDRW